MKHGAHHYYGDKIGRGFRFISKMGPLPKIRRRVWADVFGELPVEAIFHKRKRRMRTA